MRCLYRTLSKHARSKTRRRINALACAQDSRRSFLLFSPILFPSFRFLVPALSGKNTDISMQTRHSLNCSTLTAFPLLHTFNCGRTRRSLHPHSDHPVLSPLAYDDDGAFFFVFVFFLLIGMQRSARTCRLHHVSFPVHLESSPCLRPRSFPLHLPPFAAFICFRANNSSSLFSSRVLPLLPLSLTHSARTLCHVRSQAGILA